MKHIFTIAALFLATSCFGQEACPNVHDINSNGTIDIEDFLSILGLFADVDVDEDGVWDSQDDCLDATACNYLASPTEPCSYFDALGECGGACEGDGDGDGICDDVDTCVGELDECGVCNGPGPTEVVIEDITILYDSVYLPQLEEWYVYEFGADTLFEFVCAGSLDSFAEDPDLILLIDFNGDVTDQSPFNHQFTLNNYGLGFDRFGQPASALRAIDSNLPYLQSECFGVIEGTHLKLDDPILVTGEDNQSYSISMWAEFPGGSFSAKLAGGYITTINSISGILGCCCETDFTVWDNSEWDNGWGVGYPVVQSSSTWDPSPAPALSGWNHLVFVKEDDTVRLYLNGLLIQSLVLDPNSTDPEWSPNSTYDGALEVNTHDMMLEYFGGANAGDSAIDDVIILNRALSVEEVSILYDF